MHTIHIKTNQRSELINITDKIQSAIFSNNFRDGICIIFVPHTTAAITINENADPDVKIDILKQLEKIVPEKNNYKHFEGNSDAHIKSSLFGFSSSVIVESGQLQLGTWQGIYFCEFDGPRNRKIRIKFLNS